MKPSVRYRNLKPDDYHILYNIWTETPGLTTRKADTQKGYLAFLKRNPGLSFGVEADGKLIGGILGGSRWAIWFYSPFSSPSRI